MKNVFHTIALACLSAILFSGGLNAQDKSAKIKNDANTYPVVVNGETQVIPEFSDPDKWIRHDLWVETEFDSDGDGKLDRMHVGVTRPEQTESQKIKLPVIMVSSPYFAGTGGTDKKYFWDPRQEVGETPPPHEHFPLIKARNNRPVISNSHTATWIPQGYVVVHTSAPGTGLSQGCPTVGGKNESLAPKAVIDWLNDRADGFTTPDGKEKVMAYWATGKVGMTGTSYNGTIPLAAATTGVEGLEAVIPIAPNTSYWHYYRTNGLVRHPGGWLGEDIDILYGFIHSQPENCDWCNENIRDKEMAEGMDRKTGDYNDFWAERDMMNDLGPLKAPVLMAHGFNDWNVVPEHSNNISQALKAKGVPVQIYYHQGGHGGEPPFKMMNRWFTRYVLGVENGVENDPRAWIVREGDERDNPTPYADFPNPDASQVKLYLTDNGYRAGGLGTSPTSGQGIETIIDNVYFDGGTLAQAEWTNHRLMFVTPELKEDIHLSGTSTITIKASSSKPAVNLSVWMVSLPWNNRPRAAITDNLITRGWADLQNYKSMTESQPLVPGKFYEMTFNLQPDDQVIPAGQQIGLMIFCSDKEFTLWPEPGSELTVDLDGTTLSIPVVGGKNAFEKATR